MAHESETGRLVVVPMPDLRIHRRLFIIRHRDKRLPQALQAFVEMLQATATTVVS